MELEEFCRFVAQEKLEHRYAELVHDCRLHFRAYRDYLLNRGQYRSYKDYLEQEQKGTGTSAQ